MMIIRSFAVLNICLAHLNTNYRHFLLFVDEVGLLMDCHIDSIND